MMNLYVNINYDVVSETPSIVSTNIKQHKIKDILSEYVRSQMGKGEDKRNAHERDIYHIRVEQDLVCDAFSIRSDTGNDGLTTGILRDTIGKLKLEDKV